ncbi:hypothetical protein AFULGI_00025180 [Archaeoglobus fulgidus DSM 8774]|uniref:Uncharacterized protein n=1 Tax=Archaeoglobus fulgidus DSM 8774 TaxID=1344584 RepID=A0A075WNT5_ARCFL|nr:hypothetical protein [Archaeoglobus fulgidus]AIG99233.1 hypothetical protein AFULGI_00025180 [Archaeoglobus fulgidus DSM 8774]
MTPTEPFILKSAEFDHRKMVVVAETNLGNFEFPVLPPLEGQQYPCITYSENGRYIIRTREYEKLRSGEYGEEEMVKLIHEITHFDLRVITPFYSLGRYPEVCLPQKIKKFDKLGLDIRKLDNFLEDYFSKAVLKKIGLPPRVVDKVLQPEKELEKRWPYITTLLEIERPDLHSKINNETFQSYMDQIKELGGLEKLEPHGLEERMRLVVFLYLNMDLGIVKGASKNMKNVHKAIHKGDLAPLFNPNEVLKIRGFYAKLGVLKFVNEQIEKGEDPFTKNRWILEKARLTTMYFK